MANRQAAQSDGVLLFDGPGTNSPTTLTALRGDADTAFKTAAYKRREHFRVQRHGAVPMEPRGLLAEWDAALQRLTLSGTCKVAFTNRRALAAMMNLPESAVRMVEYDVGGAEAAARWASGLP